MWKKNKCHQGYYPFVTTQIQEEQNHFLLSNDFIRSNFLQFNQMLYQFIDRGFSEVSFFRIFRIKEKVSIVYYWKSNKAEPRSDRKGIYLIAGVLCDFPVFRKAPLNLLSALNCLIDMIIKEYQSYDCTEIIRKIWERQSPASFHTYILPLDENVDNRLLIKRKLEYLNNEEVFKRIDESFQLKYLQYTQKNITRQYSKRIRFGTCRLYLCLPSSVLKDIPLFFVSETSNWMHHYWGKTDIASLEGYGKCFIDVRLNNQGVPEKMKRVKLLKRFNKTYLEIQVE